MEEEKEPKKRQKEEAKLFSHRKNLAEAEMKDKNNVKDTKTKGKKQRRAKRSRADQRA